MCFSPKQRACLQAIEYETKNTFEWIGAPQPHAIMMTAVSTAADDAAIVSEDLTTLFKASAQRLLDVFDGNSVKAIAAALAVAAGYTQPPPVRSLLSSAEGYVTLLYDSGGLVVNSLGLVWAALRRAFPTGATEGSERFRGMTMIADDLGAVVDCKVDDSITLDTIKGIVANSDCLSIIDTLPKLKEKAAFSIGKGDSGGKGKGGKGKGFRSGKGGKGGGRGAFGSRGRGRGR